MRLMIDAERPEALWLALRTVQAVLRESPSALACSSSVRNPADLTASASSLILEDCRAFILALSGRWVRACTRAAEDGRNTSDECESMHRFPGWPQEVHGVPVAVRSPTSVPSGSAFCICDLLRGFWRTIASPSRCLYRCRIAAFFVSSFDARPRRSCHLRARNLCSQQYGEEGSCQ